MRKNRLPALFKTVGWAVLMTKKKSELVEELSNLYDCLSFPEAGKTQGITHCGVKYEKCDEVESIFVRLGLRKKAKDTGNKTESSKGQFDTIVSPHILLQLEDGGNSVYVLEGKDEGWHDFKTKNETIDYMNKLTEENIDFVLNPNW